MKILCIPTKVLMEKESWEGIQTNHLDYYYNLLIKSSEFKKRGPLETDPSYKQVIVQVVFEHNNKYFLHKRINTDEERIDGLAPLFIGGHIDIVDIEKGKDLIDVAFEREIDEEVYLDSRVIEKKFLGLISLTDNPVNSVHVGVMFLYKLDSQGVSIKEEGQEDLGWFDHDYLEENIDTLTYWSRDLIKSKILKNA